MRFYNLLVTEVGVENTRSTQELVVKESLEIYQKLKIPDLEKHMNENGDYYNEATKLINSVYTKYQG